MPLIIRILAGITKSTWGLKIFSIFASGIYIVYGYMFMYKDIIVLINALQKIPFEFVLIAFLAIVSIIIFILSKMPKMIKNIIVELIVKIVSNIFCTFLTVKTSLLTTAIFNLNPDVNGKLSKFTIFNTNFSLYQNFSLIEKHKWLQEIKEEININEKEFNINNIPWENITNQSELLTYILKKLQEQKLLIIQEQQDLSKPLLKQISNLLEIISNHPYLTLAFVTFTGVLIYLYYDAIVSYLLKLGEHFKQLIKTSKKHTEVTQVLVENQQIISNQITMLLEELPKMQSKTQQLTLLRNIMLNLNEVGTNVAALAGQTGQNDLKIKQLEKMVVKIVDLLQKKTGEVIDAADDLT